MDKLAFLDEPKGSQGEVAPKAEPAVVETPPAQISIPEPAAAAPIAPPTPEPVKPPDHVPLATHLELRESTKALKRELDEIKRRFEEATRAPQQPIDPLMDPEGFKRDLQATVERTRQDVLFETTHTLAVEKFGAETVKAAEQAFGEECQKSPALFQTIAGQRNPYDALVKWHKRQQAFAKIGDDDPETWAEKWAKEKGYQIPHRNPDGTFVAAPPAPQPATLPKPSLASAPAASGGAPKTPTGAGVAFDEAFK